MKSIINKIFNEIFPIVYNGIEQNYQTEVKQSYLKILQNRYSEIDKKLNFTDYEALYNSLYESEYEEWSNLSIPEKKDLLINDQAFEELIDISNKALRYAEERLTKGKFIDKEVANTYITKINLLQTKVYEHNTTKANWYSKETLVDLTYASNQSDNISTRINHLI